MLLTVDEEKSLAQRIQSGCQKSINELAVANLNLVSYVAKRFRNKGLSKDDLIQEGNLGLVRACKSFDPSKAKFSTYAYYWIEQYIRRAIANFSRTIRVPIWANDAIKEWNDAEEQLYHELGRKPNDDEIAEVTGFTKQQIDVISPSANRNIFNVICSGEEGEYEFLGEEDEIDLDKSDGLNHDNVMEMLEDLTDKERKVLLMRHGIYQEPKSLKQIGDDMGVTRERARQIHNKALNKIRHRYGQKVVIC